MLSEEADSFSNAQARFFQYNQRLVLLLFRDSFHRFYNALDSSLECVLYAVDILRVAFCFYKDGIDCNVELALFLNYRYCINPIEQPELDFYNFLELADLYNLDTTNDLSTLR